LRFPTKIRSELGTTVRLDPGNDAAIGRLRQKCKASRCAEYLKKVINSFPPLTPGQIAELQGILASRTTKATTGPSEVNARPPSRASATEKDSMVPNTAGDEYRGHGRTQWDAMTEAISGGSFRATKLALLIFVRYGICTAAGLVLVYKIIEMIGQHH
jgi:hypothetical protein